jgi:hypothetical protein
MKTVSLLSSSSVVRWARALALASSLLVAALGPSGCSTTQDPHYNRWAPTEGRPTLLRQVERGPDALGEALDNLDERVENAAY